MGIIPARAGFTLAGSDPGDRPEDHPRSRGVYTAPRSRGGSGPGSSPLARGLLAAVLVLAVGVGIIPARAGFTVPAATSGRRAGDHPRSRGVYSSTPPTALSAAGSSPLARGLREGPPGEHQQRRIIPARAGFTRPRRGDGCGGQDHPRSRGVYYGAGRTYGFGAGSSPLARGLRGPRRHRPQGPRIIPARAGFTGVRIHTPGGQTDHPRSRGVYSIPAAYRPLFRGSSPLARGLLGGDLGRRASRWIIPARAGFTGCRRARRRGPGDHPRSRGVYSVSQVQGLENLGSSPLARGLRGGRCRG